MKTFKEHNEPEEKPLSLIEAAWIKAREKVKNRPVITEEVIEPEIIQEPEPEPLNEEEIGRAHV